MVLKLSCQLFGGYFKKWINLICIYSILLSFFPILENCTIQSQCWISLLSAINWCSNYLSLEFHIKQCLGLLWLMQSYGLTWFSSFTFSLYDRYQQMIHTLKNTMITVVESLKNKSEEDQLRKEEMHQEKQHRQSNIQFTDNCSDSGSSFSRVREYCLQMMPINSCFINLLPLCCILAPISGWH